MRTTPEQRRQMANMVRKGLSKKLVSEIFGVSRRTVWKWCKRANHPGRDSFNDLPRRPKKGKITEKVEINIYQRGQPYPIQPTDGLMKARKTIRLPAILVDGELLAERELPAERKLQAAIKRKLK
jgi:transposase